MPFSYNESMSFIAWLTDYHLTTRCSVFVITHLTLGLMSEAKEKEPCLKSPGDSKSGAEPCARTGRCHPSFLLILLLSLAWCCFQGDIGYSRKCLPESVLTVYMASVGSLGFPVSPCLSWSFVYRWAQHLGGWSRPTRLPQDRPSRWLPNKLITENSAPTSEGCCFEGEVNALGFPAKFIREVISDFAMCQVSHICLICMKGFNRK